MFLILVLIKNMSIFSGFSGFSGLSVFQIPAAFVGRRPPTNAFQIPANPVVYVQHIPANKYVGCVIITNSSSGYGYDLIMPHLSGKSSYGVFSGKVGGLYSDIDCANTLARSINLNISHSTPFVEFNDPSTGNPYKIFVLYMRRFDLQRLNASIRHSIASNDFSYFSRFPTSLISSYQSMQCLKDDAGVDRFFDASACALISRIIPNIGKYV